MIPGGDLGTHIVEHSKMGIMGSFQVLPSSDGVYWNFSIAGSVRFRIRQSDGRFEVPNALMDFQSM